jgi:hypothetical protein
MSQKQNSPAVGSVRKNHMVESHSTRKQYPITGLRLYGVEISPDSKEYARFLEVVPRCVKITAKLGEGVIIEVP